MIRINLLPIRQTQKRQTIQQQLIIGCAIVVLTLIGCIIIYSSVSSQAKELQKRIRENQQKLAQLDKIIGEVNKFNEKKKELQDKLEIIESLRRGKTGPIRALDDLATETPDRVWLTELDEQNSRVTISGQAIEHEDVSAFMKTLEKSKYFKEIRLEYSKAGKANKNVTLYDFKITCLVDYSA